MMCLPCNSLEYYFILKVCKRIINNTHHDTLDSLKAFMVAPFADMRREEMTLACSRYRIASHQSINFMYNKKKQADYVIFEWVRQKLFLCDFICIYDHTAEEPERYLARPRTERNRTSRNVK